MFNLPNELLLGLAAAAGAACKSLLDALLSRRKTDLDATNQRLSAVNAANQQLVEGLFNHITSLKKDVADLREKLEHCEAQHTSARQELANIRGEVATLKAAMRPH